MVVSLPCKSEVVNFCAGTDTLIDQGGGRLARWLLAFLHSVISPFRCDHLSIETGLYSVFIPA